ncbi:MAG: potassium transporter Trk [Clostridiales bacterium]|nr:MAG: potassium transporter Trk [Clostridiales bacterium]
MKSFLIIGLGRFGKSVALTLTALGNEVLAVDKNPEIVEDVAPHVTHALSGECKDKQTLESLGVRNFDCIIVAMSESVESSILITLMLKDLGAKYVINKASTEIHARVLRQVGADKIIFPEKDMGTKLAQRLSSAGILDFIELSDKYSIVEIQMPKAWVGKTLRALNLRSNYGINVVALKNHESETIDVSPNPDGVFTENDVLVVIGLNSDIAKVTK